jgi:hypothetical protein
VFENRGLKSIFESKGKEVTGVWRKLHNEELNDLYYSPNIIQVIKSRRMRWAGYVVRIDELYTGVWWGNLSESHRPTWEDIRMDLQEAGFGGMGWIDLAQNRDRWRPF